MILVQRATGVSTIPAYSHSTGQYNCSKYSKVFLEKARTSSLVRCKVFVDVFSPDYDAWHIS